MESRTSPWTYFLGIAVGVSSALCLIINFHWNSWWQIIFLCLSGLIAGLFVVDHRAMVKIVGHCKNVFRLSLRENLAKMSPKQLSKKGRQNVFLAIRFVCYFVSIYLTFFMVNLFYPGSFQTTAKGFYIRQDIVFCTFLFSIFYFMIIWFIPIFANIRNDELNQKSEKTMFKENLRFLLFFWLITLRGIILGIVAVIIMIVSVALGSIIGGANAIRKQNNLLAAGVCIVCGQVSGMLLNSLGWGFAIAMSMGAITYVSIFSPSGNEILEIGEAKIKRLFAKVPAPKLFLP